MFDSSNCFCGVYRCVGTIIQRERDLFSALRDVNAVLVLPVETEALI